MKDKIKALLRRTEYSSILTSREEEHWNNERGYNEAINDVLKLIPDLPTDEEIDVEALYSKKQQSECMAFRDGAKWMRDQMTINTSDYCSNPSMKRNRACRNGGETIKSTQEE